MKDRQEVRGDTGETGILDYNSSLLTRIWQRARSDAWPLLGILAPLLLVCVAFVELDMLTSAFRRVFYLACAGFVVNHLMPDSQRLNFFATLCVAALFLVLGGAPDTTWDASLAFTRAIAVLAAGAVLIGVCLLPIAFHWRVSLLVVAGGAIALLRSNVIEIEPLLVAWPVLASLFMFRLMIFLYDLHAGKMKPRMGEIVSYFFLFPNVASTLFPLVDFKTLCRSHYDSDAFEIYRRGVRWIIRGLLQLLAYRLIQQLVAMEPDAIKNGTELIQFILASTFVYLQVSGYFHLVIGMLLLFGFNLPETNRRYFLASSFTEYWRRVNIYWKDFIVKVVYYPAYFRLKSRGAMFALVLATLWSFFVTWVLHLYQTWWLKGAAPLSWPDILFWSILAVLVLVNSVVEMKRGRQRKLASSTYDLRSSSKLMLRTAATFTSIALLWSLWSSPTLSGWLSMWRFADGYTVLWAALTLTCIMAACYFYEIRPSKQKSAASDLAPTSGIAHWLRSAAAVSAPLMVVLVAGQPTVQSMMDRAPWQPWFDALNTGDSMMDKLVSRNRGYYERLTSVDDANRQLWETLRRQRLPNPYSGENPIRSVKDFRFHEPIPGVHLHAYYTDFQTNSYGFRDREFALQAAPDELRIALMGSSNVMGWGVPVESTFARQVERLLNERPPAQSAPQSYSVLNFAFNDHSPLGQIEVLNRHVKQFHPDVVLVVMHALDYDWMIRDLPRALRANVPIESEFLRQVLHDARIRARTHELIAEERLKPYEKSVAAWVYHRLAQDIRAMGAIPMAVLLPVPWESHSRREVFAAQAVQIREAGFELHDLSKIFADLPMSEIAIADGHTSEGGHTIVAAELYQRLVANRTFLSAESRTAATR